MTEPGRDERVAVEVLYYQLKEKPAGVKAHRSKARQDFRFLGCFKPAAAVSLHALAHGAENLRRVLPTQGQKGAEHPFGAEAGVPSRSRHG